ncbi:hypothetical protein GGI12_001123 [Dipsacomyces acuminosporus]|nr:hypothetical protein GGI12_001123 [Dipsacomyces acuminosporus]
MTTTYPNITIDILRERLTIRKYKCNLAETNTKPGEHLPHNSTSGSQGRSGNIVSTKGYMDVIDSLKKTHQACFVLKDLRSSNVDGSKGANIMFVTDSINRIINVDSCDLQNQPFLSLVAHEDVTRAAGFLEKALYGDALVVEKLHLLYDPLESSPLGKPKRVSVEFMAMGSDAGAILLCQLDKATGAARGKNNNTNNNNSDVYLSLEDIISSDPETSDFALMY